LLAEGLCRPGKVLFSLAADPYQGRQVTLSVTACFGSMSKGVFTKTKGRSLESKANSLESNALRLESERLFVEHERLLCDRTAHCMTTKDSEVKNLVTPICLSVKCATSFDGGRRFSAQSMGGGAKVRKPRRTKATRGICAQRPKASERREPPEAMSRNPIGL
jgi:hypothetical protein